MARGQVRCGFCDIVFDALGALEEDWKENLSEHGETTDHELVFTDGDIEEFNKIPEGSVNPPEVYEEDDFPLEEIIAQTEQQPQKEKSSTDNAEEEPSALAELFSQSPPTFPYHQESGANPDIEKLTDNLSVEPDNNPVIAKDDDLDMANDIKLEEAPGVLRDELKMVITGNPENKTALWVAGIVLLTLVFALQVIYAKREDIAKQEEFRGLMLSMCEVLPCEIPMRNDALKGINTMVIQSHAIDSIKGKPDQLRISAIFSNTASYTQAYPVLSIKLSDSGDNISAMRRFKPDEYLAKHINVDSGLPAKTAVEVIIDIVKPRTPVSSYQFGFY